MRRTVLINAVVWPCSSISHFTKADVWPIWPRETHSENVIQNKSIPCKKHTSKTIPQIYKPFRSCLNVLVFFQSRQRQSQSTLGWVIMNTLLLKNHHEQIWCHAWFWKPQSCSSQTSTELVQQGYMAYISICLWLEQVLILEISVSTRSEFIWVSIVKRVYISHSKNCTQISYLLCYT